jgi:O-antigen/teichoic acid export membrane protein
MRVRGGSSPGARLRRGLAWNATSVLSTHGLNFLRYVVVARLLSFEAFGLFAMVNVAMLAAYMLSTWGWRQAFIAQHRDPENPDPRQQALWTADLLARATATGLLALAAPLIARGFGEPVLGPLIAVSSLYVLGHGLRHPALLDREREMEFRVIAVIELSGAVAGLIVAVVGALLLRSVWALVLGQVAASLVPAALSYVLLGRPGRPRLDRALVRQGFHFARGVLGISVLGWIVSQVDNALIGAALGAAALGLFAIAHRLAEIPKVAQDMVISRAVYPYYVKALQEGVGALARAWITTGRYTLWLLWLAYLPLLVAPEFVLGLLFGARWDAAADALRLLALAGILRGISVFLAPVLLALQRPGLDVRIKLVETAVFVGVAAWGAFAVGRIEAVAAAGVAGFALGLGLRLRAVCRGTRTAPRDLWPAWRGPAAGLAVALLPQSLQGGAHPAALLAATVLLLAGAFLLLERDGLRRLRGLR